ncbi:MAG: thioredoxin-dependent thiol peroxidase [Candidatus Woesearchaeota archaeon]|nr:thioredoxin-dependent thiol peroxidase [Candidatus Woesearchaeota archaeon]
MVAIGSRAPAFTLTDTNGKKVQLSKLRGTNVVLYFYPKDDTPGCTCEANEFTALLPHFKKLNTLVFGVSKDTVEQHKKFTKKHALDVPLLSDPDGKMIEKYGFWVEKNMYGKKYMGIQRATVLIDEAGKITHIWDKVKPKGHAAEVLEQVKAL